MHFLSLPLSLSFITLGAWSPDLTTIPGVCITVTVGGTAAPMKKRSNEKKEQRKKEQYQRNYEEEKKRMENVMQMKCN
jgi:flagellar biosynthesis component FlhA